MLFGQEALQGIAAGRIDLAYRRWRRPSVRAGTHLRTAVGVVRIRAAAQVADHEVTEADARRAGFPDAAGVLAALAHRAPDLLYRIELEPAGPDPRLALRERNDLSADEVDALRDRLVRLDRHSRRGPWTRATLRAIATRPAVVSTELAAALDVDRPWFKANVRKLKELGLTVSLERGYRLSPRDEALLVALDREGDEPPD